MRMPTRHGTVLLIFITLAGLASAQTNWPAFRGPNAWGVAAGADTATTWDVEKSENILWTTPIPGLGHSSPIIWGDRLFVTTAVNQSKTAPLKVGLYGDPASAEDNEVQGNSLARVREATFAGAIAQQRSGGRGLLRSGWL